jgi:hypothetical protein
MNSATAKLINEERVMQLLDCYGADAQCWPEEERAAALTLIKHSVELQRYHQQARELDDMMQVHPVRQELGVRPSRELVASIVDGFPDQPQNNTVQLTDHLKAKKAAVAPRWWKYSAVAAAAVLVLALTLIIEQPEQVSQPVQPLAAADASQGDIDQWFWDQATGVSDEVDQGSAQDDSDAPTTFMAMVELESSGTEDSACSDVTPNAC